MGLPIFREPEVVDAAQTAVKPDPTAHSRSGIRRQRTVRHPPQDAASLRWRNRLARGRDSFDGPRDHPVREPPTAVHPFEISRPRERSSDLLRHVLRTDRSSQRARASRESLLRYAVDESANFHPLDSTGRQYVSRYMTLHSRMLSPPYTGGDRNTRSPPMNGRDTPTWSPRFAPAYRMDNDLVLGRLSPPDSLSPPRDGNNEEDEPELGGILPLRRVGHRSISDSNRPPSRHARLSMDGLGDRERSFSPEEDSWENLLSSIAPDENLPSTDSSFTSAAATSFTSQPAASSTQLTAPTSIEDQDRERDNEFFPDCNISDSESTGSDASESRIVFPPSMPSPPPRPSEPSSDSPFTSERQLYIMDEERRRREPFERFQRLQRYDLLARERRARVREHERQERRRQALVENDQELGQMRAILDRLSRREDIPDEWWAAAGLTRSNVAGGETGNVGGEGTLDSLGSQLQDLMGRISRLERERL